MTYSVLSIFRSIRSIGRFPNGPLFCIGSLLGYTVPGSAVLLMHSLAFNGVAKIFVRRCAERAEDMSCDMCHVSGLFAPSRLSNIGAVTEAETDNGCLSVRAKLNYLNILNFIDINTTKDTIHNEILFIRLDKKSEKS